MGGVCERKVDYRLGIKDAREKRKIYKDAII